MSFGMAFVIVGALIFLVGIYRMGSSQNGGLSLKNFGIAFGGSNTQNIKVGNVTPETAKALKFDWIGLAIALIGLVTAIFGLFK